MPLSNSARRTGKVSFRLKQSVGSCASEISFLDVADRLEEHKTCSISVFRQESKPENAALRHSCRGVVPPVVEKTSWAGTSDPIATQSKGPHV